MWVLPGSHCWGLIEAARNKDMNVHPAEGVEQRGTSTAVEMLAGDVLFMTNLTFHSSKMNVTNSSRWSVGFRYHAAPAALSGRQRSALEEFHDRLREGGLDINRARGRVASAGR